MKKNFLVLVILTLICGACSSGGYRSSTNLAAGIDPIADIAESECSYFYFMWGRTAELEGKLEEAREAYEKALVCDLHAVHVMRRLAFLLVDMGKKDVAAVWLQAVIDENPEDLTSYAPLANLYVSMDEFEKAEEIYLGVLAKNPGAYDNMLLLGALYARQKKFGEAIKTLEKLVKLNPESFVGYHYLAKVYIETEDFEKARSSFETALQLKWSPFLAFEAAIFLQKRGYDKDALALYRQIIADDEGNERVRTMAISLLLRMNRIDEAIVELQELLPFSADAPKVELNLSRLLLERKKYDEAISHLENILDGDPEFDSAGILMAVAYHDKGDVEAAIKTLEMIGAQNGDYENATVFLTRIFVDEKKYLSAASLLQERISDPKTRRKSFYPALAAVLQKQQKSEEAIKVFQEAMVVYPDDKDLLMEYALLQDENKDEEGALLTMAMVLVIDPDETYAHNYIGYTLAESGRELDKALVHVKKAIELKPDDGFIRDSLGWVLFKLGRYEEALVELQKAVVVEGEDPTINEHLGDIYLKLGKIKKARNAWERALELEKDEAGKILLRKKIEAAGK